MDKRHQFIDSVAFVLKRIKKEDSLEFKKHQIHQVMKQDLKMRFRKVKPIAITANSPRNLILRQQFALQFLKIDLQKKVVINLDETWLAMTDFRR